MSSIKSRQRELRKTYDRWDRYDSQLMSLSYQGPRIIAEHLEKYLPARAKILDVGCGTGLAGIAIKRRVTLSTLIGVDWSRGMLDQARRKRVYDDLGRANLRRALPFKNRSFDAVVCVGVFEHFRTVRRELKELARISKRVVAFYVLVAPFSGYHHHGSDHLIDVLCDAGLFPIELFPFTAYHHALALGVIAKKYDNRLPTRPAPITYFPALPSKTSRTIRV